MNEYFENSFDELVFENRNKDYGSFVLRSIITKNTLRGFLFTIVGVIIFILFFSFRNKNNEPAISYTEVILTDPPPIIQTLPPAVPPAIKKIASTELKEMVVKEDEKVNDEKENKNEDDKSDTTTTGTSKTGTDNKSILNGDGVISYMSIEVKPEYSGGKIGLSKYLRDNMKYPTIAKNNNIQGTVNVIFTINEDGSVSDVKLAKGIGGGCDQEAIRVVTEMRKWKPGMQGGIPRKCWMEIPITFKLSH